MSLVGLVENQKQQGEQENVTEGNQGSVTSIAENARRSAPRRDLAGINDCQCRRDTSQEFVGKNILEFR